MQLATAQSLPCVPQVCVTCAGHQVGVTVPDMRDTGVSHFTGFHHLWDSRTCIGSKSHQSGDVSRMLGWVGGGGGGVVDGRPTPCSRPLTYPMAVSRVS